MPAPSNIADLITAARCFRCIPPSTQFEVQTFIIATASGLGTDRDTLINLSKCLRCLSLQTLIEVKAYLLATLAGISTDTQDLIERAKCYDCIPDGMMGDVQTYLLSLDPNGPGITDPNQLANQARCFRCASTETLMQIQVYLLAHNAGVSTDPNDLARLAKCFICLPYPVLTSVITRTLNDLENDGGVSGCVDVPADLIPVITVNYVAGVANTIDILFPKVCCQPNSFTIYESNNADMSASVDLDVIPMTGSPGEENFTVAGVDVSGATRMFLAVKQNCLDGTVSDYSNIEMRQDLLVNLAAYWKMDEAVASGPRSDSFGAETLTDVVPNIPSQAALISNGARFNLATVTQRLRHIDDAVLGIGAGVSFTFSLWVQLIQDATNAPFLAKFAPAPLYDYVLVEFAGNVNWTVRDIADTAFFTAISPGLPPIGPWIHFACGYDDALQQIWIQRNAGARVSTPVVGVRRTASDFCIGNYSDGSGGGDFIIDEVGFWRRSLDTQAVSLLYNGGVGLTYPF